MQKGWPGKASEWVIFKVTLRDNNNPAHMLNMCHVLSTFYALIHLRCLLHLILSTTLANKHFSYCHLQIEELS